MRTFEFEDKVSVVDLLSLIVTAILTVLVGVYAHKRFGDRRAEVDLIHSHLSAMGRKVDSVYSTFKRAVESGGQTSQIVQELDELGNQIESLREMLRHARFSSFQDEVESLNRRFIDLRRATTGIDLESQEAMAMLPEASRLKGEIKKIVFRIVFALGTR